MKEEKKHKFYLSHKMSLYMAKLGQFCTALGLVLASAETSIKLSGK